MRRIALALALTLVVAFTVTACGKEAAPTNTAAGFTCPDKPTESFAKTRFVADIGLAVGTFHHWIYKPWKAGKLQKGANHRLWNLGKAAAAGALDAKLVSNAAKNVKADPALCSAIGEPLAKLGDMVSNLKSSVMTGDFGKLAEIETATSGITGLMASKGAAVTENYQG